MLKKVLLSVLLLSIPASFAAGQQTASINGTILDPTGAVVAGASVRVEKPTGVLVEETKTDAKGSFQFSNIPAGTYALTVPAYLGLGTKSVPLHLAANVSGLKIRLNTEMVSQDVVVGAEDSPTLDASTNLDTVTVTGSDLRNTPVFDQDFIATMTPFLDASSGSSGGVTIIVDGVEMQNVPISASAIQEIRTNNDPYSAEYTRPGRGRIEIITKPGSPEFHGEF